MKLVTFNETAYRYSMSFLPARIVSVTQNKERPNETILNIDGLKVPITVYYDYQTTCRMINDSLSDAT